MRWAGRVTASKNNKNYPLARSRDVQPSVVRAAAPRQVKLILFFMFVCAVLCARCCVLISNYAVLFVQYALSFFIIFFTFVCAVRAASHALELSRRTVQ